MLLRHSEPDELAVATLEAGAHFGEIALVLRATRNATVRAVAFSDLYELTKADCDDFLALYPVVLDKLHTQAAARSKETAALAS